LPEACRKPRNFGQTLDKARPLQDNPYLHGCLAGSGLVEDDRGVRRKTRVAKVTGGTDPCRLVRQVNEFGGSLGPVVTAPDPCRLARQVKPFRGSARELLHRPHEAAGVEEKPEAQRKDVIGF
jgi:hypothetical protein